MIFLVNSLNCNYINYKGLHYFIITKKVIIIAIEIKIENDETNRNKNAQLNVKIK